MLIRSNQIKGRNVGLRSVQMATKILNGTHCGPIGLEPNLADLPENTGRVLENQQRWWDSHDTVSRPPIPAFKPGRLVRLRIQSKKDLFRKAGMMTYSPTTYRIRRIVSTEPALSYRIADARTGRLFPGTISEVDLLPVKPGDGSQ